MESLVRVGSNRIFRKMVGYRRGDLWSLWDLSALPRVERTPSSVRLGRSDDPRRLGANPAPVLWKALPACAANGGLACVDCSAGILAQWPRFPTDGGVRSTAASKKSDRLGGVRLTTSLTRR